MQRALLAPLALAFPLLVASSAPLLATGCDAPLGDPFPGGAGHDHRDPAQHAFATSNVEKLSHVDLPRFATDAGVGAPVLAGPVVMDDAHDAAVAEAAQAGVGGALFGEVDLFGDYAALAVIGSPIGVWILDVSDPASPAALGRWTGPASGYVTDVKWSSDGTALYASVQAGSQVGVFLIDARDRTAPVTLDFEAVANGVHMIAVQTLSPGVDVVHAATAYANGIFPFLAAPASVPALAPLTPISGVTAHDAWVTVDDLTGRTFLYVANSYGGVRILDVTNPLLAVPVASWAGISGHYMHSVRAEVDDGKRIVYVTPEYFFGTSTTHGKMYVLDATDLASVRVIGSWGNPGGHPGGELWWSPHNFQLVDDTIYLAHYHGGVWVLDASDPAAIAARGYYLPHDHRYTGGPTSWAAFQYAPSDWDVALKDGRMFVGDISGGLYVLRYACDAQGPGGPTSRG